jgi:hypothetical protein
MKELERAHGATEDFIAPTDATIGATGQAFDPTCL